MTGDASILFRCDGDSQVGLGHVYRCIALANELRKNHECRITFAIMSGKAGIEIVKNANYPIEYNLNGTKEEDWLDEIISKVKPDSLVLDVRTGIGRNIVDRWREEGVLIVTIDDPEDKRLAADLAFCPPVPGVRLRDWSELAGNLFVGWEWVPLRKMFAQSHHKVKRDRLNILVSMGGSDEAGFTLKAIEALNKLDREFDTTVIMGGAYAHPQKLKEALSQTNHRFKVMINVANMSEIMANTDLAIASFGVTAYELAAMGVPAIYLCLKDDHVLSASAFVDAGIIVSLGLGSEVSVHYLMLAIRELLRNETKRDEMTKNARLLMDGKGAERIAAIIIERIDN